jgi:hypothetical protein
MLYKVKVSPASQRRKEPIFIVEVQRALLHRVVAMAVMIDQKPHEMTSFSDSTGQKTLLSDPHVLQRAAIHESNASQTRVRPHAQ